MLDRLDSSQAAHVSRRHAFTLVELLVVIAIIGILVALLLPAVQAARESARRTQCTNNLKNLTLGMLNHESSTGRMPSSGWSGHWTGDPDRGTDAEQPGGWLYSILPFIEQQQVYDMGQGLTGAARTARLRERDAIPLSVMNCPTRRDGGPYQRSGGSALSGNGSGGESWYPMTLAARGDYAASVGDQTNFDGDCLGRSPNSYDPNRFGNNFPPSTNEFNGITYCGTAVKTRQIIDGMTKTIALGERWVPADVYESGNFWLADDWNLYVGFQDDTVRSTFYAFEQGLHSLDNPPPATHTPRSDTDAALELSSLIRRELFGGPHQAGCLFSMCDGSVELVEFDVDPEVFRRMGSRKDEGKYKVYQRRRG